jgi:AAHS family 4-hydroxybenzoate transporter-like MFS transporter
LVLISLSAVKNHIPALRQKRLVTQVVTE